VFGNENTLSFSVLPSEYIKILYIMEVLLRLEKDQKIIGQRGEFQNL